MVQDTTDLNYVKHPATEGLRPISESYLRGLWVQNSSVLALGEAVEAIGSPPEQVQWVYVADRESDIFELFVTILSQGSDFCIRLVQERRLVDWTMEQPMYLLKAVRDLPEKGNALLSSRPVPGKRRGRSVWL